MKTKKRFSKLTAWLLTLAMIMTFIPSFTLTASAAETYDLWVGGEQFTSEKLTITDDTGGTAKYDPESKTLTLTNYNFAGDGYNGEEYAAIYYGGTDMLNLVLEGNSTVTQQNDAVIDGSYGIFSEGSITVSGNGSLTINSGSADYESCGLYVNYKGDNVIVLGGKLIANGGAANVYSKGVYVSNGSFIISDGTVEAHGGTADISYGIDVYVDVNVSGGSITATGGTANEQSYGVDVTGNITVTGGSLTAKGGEATAESGQSRGVYGDNYNISISGTGKLDVAGGAAAESDGIFALFGSIAVSDSGILTANGGTSTKSRGIKAQSGTITVSDNGMLTANGGTADDSCGVDVSAYGSIKVLGGSLRASGKRYGVYNEYYGTITLGGGETIAQGETSAFYTAPTIADTFANAAVWHGTNEDQANREGEQPISELVFSYIKKYVKIAEGTPAPSYDIIVNNSENGTVEADVSEAAEGDTVVLTITPDDGFEIDTVSYSDGTNDFKIVAVGDAYSFTMPASDVTVSATFKLITEHTINWSGSADIVNTPEFDLTQYLPKDISIEKFSILDLPNILSGYSPTYSANSASVKLTTRVFDEPYSETVNFVVESSNYPDITFKIVVSLTGKYIITIKADAQNALYDGNAHAGFENVSGTLSNGNPYEGTYTYSYETSDGTALDGAPIEVGDYKVTIAVPEDNETYKGSFTVEFSILAEPQASYQSEENGEWKNGTFNEALANVYDGGTVKLLSDIILDSTVALSRNVTITSANADNVCTITTETNAHSYLLNVIADVSLENIIVDGGSKNGLTAKRALIAVNGGKLNIGSGAVVRNNNNTTDNGIGGGVCCITGELVLDGGTITGNTGYFGGGVGLAGGVFTAKSGSITGNNAKMGGGVCVWENGGNVGTLNVIGNVSIKENTAEYYGGGVNCHFDGSVTLSGNPVISNNTSPNETDGGIYLDGNGTDGHASIYVNGLSEGAEVSFYTWLRSEGLLISKPAGDYTISDSDITKMKWNGDDFVLARDNDGNVVLANPPISYTVTFDEGEGTGTKEPVTDISGEYRLPWITTTDFVAPEGKEFKGWEINGTIYAENAVINVTSNITAKAIWVIPTSIQLQSIDFYSSKAVGYQLDQKITRYWKNGDSSQFTGTPDDYNAKIEWSVRDGRDVATITFKGANTADTDNTNYGLTVLAANTFDVDIVVEEDSVMDQFTLYSCDVSISGDGKLTIVDPKVDSQNIYVDGNLTLSEANINAESLNKNAANIIFATGNLVIDNSVVEIRSGSDWTASAYPDYNFAPLRSNGTMTISNGSNVSVTCIDGTTCHAVMSLDDITIEDSTVTVTNNGTNRGISSEKNIYIKQTANGTTNVEVYGNGIAIAARNGKLTISGGTVNATSATTYAALRADEIEISGGSVTANGVETYGIYAEVGDITISGDADVSATAETSIAVYAIGNINISGNADVSASSITHTAICAEGNINISENANVKASGEWALWSKANNIAISGGTVEAIGSSYALVSKPVLTGYTNPVVFAGVDTSSAAIIVDTVNTSYHNMYYVKVQAGYIVTFADYDGRKIDIQVVEHGSAATAPENPVREGYIFTSWDKAFDNVTSNLTVTAQYEEKGTVSITESAQTFTYDNTEKVFDILGTSLTGFTVEYYIEDTWTTAAPKNTGIYNVRITRDEDDTYKVFDKTLEDALIIEKATPTYTTPTNLTATYGQTVADVQGLTIGFAFMAEDTTSVGNAGDNTFKLKFTPADTNNYNVVENIDATVIVAQKEIGIEWGNTEFIYNKTEQKPTATATDLVAGDSCAITVTGGQINAGNGYVATADSLSNANYKLPASSTTTFSIAQKSVTITGVTIEATRVYNRDTDVTITNYGAVSNVIEGDTVTVNTAGASATYNDKNVGDGKSVTFTDFAITGADAANYVLTGQPESQSANITPKPVTITGVTVAATKSYDANTTATIENNGSVDGVISGDTVDVNSSNATAVYADANIGIDKEVTFAGFAISGADTSNYELSAQPASTTANITAKDITGAEITLGEPLTYNGNDQTQTIASATVDGLTITYGVSGNVNTDAGDYTLTITGNGNFEGTAQKAYTIATADATLGTVPTAKTDLIYDSEEQTLIDAGSEFTGGTLMYKLNDGEYSAELPKATDAGIYTVYYKVFGDNNHNDTAEQQFTVTIAEKTINPAIVLTAPVANAAPQTTIETDEYTASVVWSPEVTDKFAYSTAYTATITLTAKANYTVTGITENGYTASGAESVTNTVDSGNITVVYAETGRRPSSGGGYSNTTTTTTKNEDGSTTKITTNKSTGTVTEVTTNTDGSTTTVETKKDGTVTTTEKEKDGNTVTTVEKPDGTSTTTEKNKDGSEKVTEEKADGTTITTEKDTDGTKTVTTENADGSTTTEETKKDGTKVTTETNADGETKTEIDLPKDKETEVTIPVTDAEDVTSITVTDKDGKKTEITDFEITEDGVKVTVSGDCTAVINKAAKKEFADVHSVNHWATADIDYAYIKGLMMGTSETHFSPDVPLTRAMLVTVLYRLEGEPATNRSIPFADVDMGAYYASAVSWAKQNGIVNGVTENEFAPNDNITREQIAAIMHRYAQYKGYDVSVGENTNILSYDDFDSISEYAIASMQYACGSGLMKGKTTSTLNPLDNATRAEIAAILHRFIEANK